MHSRGIFCCRKKREGLNSFFPTQTPASHLSHSPLCFGASLDENQRDEGEPLGWGKRQRIAEGQVHSSDCSSSTAQGIPFYPQIAVKGLSSLAGAASGALRWKTQEAKSCCRWVLIVQHFLSHWSHCSKNSVIFEFWLTWQEFLFTLPSISCSNFHQCLGTYKTNLVCGWRVKINAAE